MEEAWGTKAGREAVLLMQVGESGNGLKQQSGHVSEKDLESRIDRTQQLIT